MLASASTNPKTQTAMETNTRRDQRPRATTSQPIAQQSPPRHAHAGRLVEAQSAIPHAYRTGCRKRSRQFTIRTVSRKTPMA